MCRYNLFRTLSTTVAFASLTLSTALADDSFSPTASVAPVAFQVSLRHGELVGSDQIQRAVASFGTNQLMMVLPRGLRVEASSPDKMILVPVDYAYCITIRLLRSSDDTSIDLAPASLASILRERYTGIVINDVVSTTVCDRTATVFEAQWKTAGAISKNVRVAFVPSAMGTLEVSVVADDPKAQAAIYDFNVLLGSFRSNEFAPIAATVYSDAS